MKTARFDSLAMLYFKIRLRYDFIKLEDGSSMEDILQASEILKIVESMRLEEKEKEKNDRAENTETDY